jgi:hypothetical protein
MDDLNRRRLTLARQHEIGTTAGREERQGGKETTGNGD